MVEILDPLNSRPLTIDDVDHIFSDSVNARISVRLSTASVATIENVIADCLGLLGYVYDADRAFIFVVNQVSHTMSNTHEWCRDGITPQIDNLQNRPLSDFAYTMRHFEQHRVLIIPRVDDLPPQAETEKCILKMQGIQSGLLAPMVTSNGWRGFLGLDAVRKEIHWSEKQGLSMMLLAQLFANAIERCRMEIEKQGYVEHLAQAVMELSETEERFRFALSSELHDGMAQQLAVAKMRLHTMKNRNASASLRKDIESVEAMIGDALRQIRHTILNASPQWVTSQPLDASLKQLIEHLGEYAPTRMELRCPVGLSLPETVTLLSFRAVQELLFNVIKHAAASRCLVRVREWENHLVLAVMDDGQGFIPASECRKGQSNAMPTYGLASMKLRLGAIGGNFNVRSRIGRGSVIRVAIPLDPHRSTGRSLLLINHEEEEDAA